MKKMILLLFTLALAATALRAQDYNWGIGIRGGAVASGVTVKANLGGANALEGIVCFARGVNIYGLYERYVPLQGKGLSFYYGGGGNIGTWKRKGEEKFTVGIDGVLGLEYKIPEVPVAFGIDYKPTLNFIGHARFEWYDFGLHVRVVF